MKKSVKSKIKPDLSHLDDKRCAALFLKNQLCFAAYTASRKIVQTYQPHLDRLGLTYLQFLAMLVLWEHDGITVSELGEQLFLDSGTLSPLLKKLEARKLLVRKRQLKDERSVLLLLTPEGAALHSKALDVPERMACALHLSTTEMKVLKTQLEKLYRRLHDSKEPMTKDQ